MLPLRRQILMQIREHVALRLYIRRRERHACSRSRVNSRRVIDEIRVHARFLDLLGREVFRKLIDDRADHLKMRKLLGTDIGEDSLQLGIRHSVALAEIAQRSAKLPVGTAIQ